MATFYNQATLSYNGKTTTSNITTGEIVQVLSVTKTAVGSSYGSNENITYVISIVNSGTVPFTDITITDNLGAYEFGSNSLYPMEYVDGSIQYYVNGALQTAPAVTAGDSLVISQLGIPAGGNATIVYQTKTNEYAPTDAGGSISNTVTVTGGGIAEPLTAEAVVNAKEGAELTISKSICPQTVTENGRITYTFVIQNTGNTPADATAAVVVMDTFSPVLDITSVTFNGNLWSEGTQYTYDGTTGVFATTAGAVTVPAATSVQDAQTGAWSVTPGISTLTISGTI